MRAVFQRTIHVWISSLLLSVPACGDPSSTESPTPSSSPSPSPETTPADHPAGWTDETHGKDAAPNYTRVFPQTEVKRLDITVAPEDWEALLAQLTEELGEFGAGMGGNGGGGGQPPGGDTTSCEGKNEGDACSSTGDETQPDGVCAAPPMGGTLMCLPEPSDEAVAACEGQAPQSTCNYTDETGADISGMCVATVPGAPAACMPTGGAPPQGGEGGAIDFVDADLIYVPATVVFEGKTWWHVGLRFKGNSTLSLPWSTGSYKLPFKLDFDEFEADYPQIEDQRFYGFKQLTLNNNANDDSLLREKVMGDLFRAAGIPAAQSAFYRLYLDHGEGLTYFGLYTMVEIIGSDFLNTTYGAEDGNLYKPEGTYANWTAFDAESFPKENNEDEADWSDVEASITALHASRADAEVWRTGLEATFNVPGFMNWLALNTLAVNWDTYGVLAHNYYVYAAPEDGKLQWIPWDHNESLKNDGGMSGPVSLSLEEVTDDWPLIRYLMDDPVYEAQYREALSGLLTGAFAEDKVSTQLEEKHALIAPYVVGSEGEQASYTNVSSTSAFESSVSALKEHVASRHAEAQLFLNP